jgi:hypothetical protein
MKRSAHSPRRRPSFGCITIGWQHRVHIGESVYRLLEGNPTLERQLEERIREHEMKMPTYLPRGTFLTTTLWTGRDAIRILTSCGYTGRLSTRVSRGRART